ncbi:unnamed protein product [Psylliodes chrysocephalus]|uniref:SHSP domain-containing protein n=1 Tax=Psylliodes chrysocephalus TaxID=3402493 RepID=A0A9P0CI71_9CUCU|nr:unnamed protein product [Psylliodes chrysocephala]
MSHIPIIFREFLRPLRMMEYQMKQAEELFRPSLSYFNMPRVRLEYPDEVHQEEAVIEDKDKFQVKLNVQDFKPENIVVKTVDGNVIHIEAKHEIKHDNDKGFELKQLVRRFVLPTGHDIKNSYSTLSADGVLTITTPKIVKPVEEKTIPITHENIEDNK